MTDQSRKTVQWQSNCTDTSLLFFVSPVLTVQASTQDHASSDLIVQQQGENLSEVRTKMQKQLHILSYAQQFWNLFRSFVHTVLRQPQHQMKEVAEAIFNHIDKTI